MELREKLKILNLSPKEEKVLLAVIEGLTTPLAIAERTKVSRPAVYEILKKLKNRGIANTHIVNGKKYWRLVREEEIDAALYEAKKVLLSISEGSEEVRGLSDGVVIVHRGKEAVRKVITALPKEHKREWFYMMQGDAVQEGWDRVIGQNEINDFNTDVIKNEIITRGVLPYGWLQNQVRRLGDKDGAKWAKGFVGRAHSAHQIDASYFDHAGQIFIFKNSLYLMSVGEAVIIEIRNSELQKLLKQMFAFIEDHAEKFNMSEQAERIVQEFESRF